MEFSDFWFILKMKSYSCNHEEVYDLELFIGEVYNPELFIGEVLDVIFLKYSSSKI